MRRLHENVHIETAEKYGTHEKGTSPELAQGKLIK